MIIDNLFDNKTVKKFISFQIFENAFEWMNFQKKKQKKINFFQRIWIDKNMR